MHASWLSLIPAFIVLATACITRSLNGALITGLITAALIATDLDIISGSTLLAKRIWGHLSDPDYLLLFGFLIIVGILIVLIAKIGGARAFARAMSKKVSTARGTQMASVGLSFLTSIDDYLSNLTVGYVMRPLCDRFNIPRVKLAFLVHSLSGPLVVLIPVSSWIAMITSQLDGAGIGTVGSNLTLIGEPFSVYIQSVPYIFYSIILIASILFIITFRISYGPMKQYEQLAQKTGNLHGGNTPPKDPISNTTDQEGHLFDLALPISILIIGTILGMAFMGGFYLFGGNKSFLDSLQSNSDSTYLVLFSAAITSLIATLLQATVQSKINKKEIYQSFSRGIQLMYPAIVMVLLASTLGVLLREDLLAGTYLAQLLQGSLPLPLLPVTLYFISLIMAIVTGSSWGTIMLLTPITVQMLTTLLGLHGPVDVESVSLLFPVLGAILSGAVCGDHISPISETTIMASTSTGVYPLEHVYTQLFYVIPIIICTSVAFLIAGFTVHLGAFISSLFALFSSLMLCCTLLYFLSKWAKNNKNN